MGGSVADCLAAPLVVWRISASFAARSTAFSTIGMSVYVASFRHPGDTDARLELVKLSGVAPQYLIAFGLGNAPEASGNVVSGRGPG